MAQPTRRLVLVHDWLTGMRGGEKCLEAVCRRHPDARLYALLHRAGAVSRTIEALRPRTSWLQLLPGVSHYYRYLLPFMPLAVNWRLPQCDLVLSFSHCVAKSVVPPAGVPHVCYCFTPMRYAWHMRDAYFGERPTLKRRALEAVLSRLRDWDRRTAAHVSHFVAISKTVQQRIRECYGRDSEVIYPPVDTEFYQPATAPREDFYLVVSALAPYKRIDLAIAACQKLGRKLVIIGAGQDARRLRTSTGAVQFLGWQSDQVIRTYLQRCRALLFPGEEDFGIVPLEAHACGTPVIAYGRGGATETVVPAVTMATGRVSADQAMSNRSQPDYREPTGIWFMEQSADCLIEAVQEFERRHDEFSAQAARHQAERFSRQRFEASLFGLIDRVMTTVDSPREQPQPVPVS